MVRCDCGLVWCFSCKMEGHWPASCEHIKWYKETHKRYLLCFFFFLNTTDIQTGNSAKKQMLKKRLFNGLKNTHKIVQSAEVPLKRMVAAIIWVGIQLSCINLKVANHALISFVGFVKENGLEEVTTIAQILQHQLIGSSLIVMVCGIHQSEINFTGVGVQNLSWNQIYILHESYKRNDDWRLKIYFGNLTVAESRKLRRKKWGSTSDNQMQTLPNVKLLSKLWSTYFL